MWGLWTWACRGFEAGDALQSYQEMCTIIRTRPADVAVDVRAAGEPWCDAHRPEMSAYKLCCFDSQPTSVLLCTGGMLQCTWGIQPVGMLQCAMGMLQCIGTIGEAAEWQMKAHEGTCWSVVSEAENPSMATLEVESTATTTWDPSPRATVRLP